MARQKPVRVIRKSDAAPRRTARDIGREQAAARAAYSGGVQGYGIGFNGDLVNTPSGPVWVPHGTAPPADAYENRLAGDGSPQPQTQAQLDPNSNLYRYREQARANTEQTPPMPAPFDFPDTYAANPGPTPIVGGYNDPNQANGPGPRPVTQPTNPFTGGMGPPAPGGAEPGPGPNAPGAGPGAPGGPNNPFDPGVGPPAPGTPIGIPNQPGQLQGLLAAYGYTTGPNGELLPIHLRQGMSPFQNQPGQQGHPPYTLPGFGGG